MTPVFVDDRLFDAAELSDDLGAGPDGGAGLRVARRWLLLSWLLAGGTWGGPGEQATATARQWWTQHQFEWRHWRPATLTTILFQLEALGAVEGFEAVDGGFHVQLAKELPL